jgi:hypothetical protein
LKDQEKGILSNALLKLHESLLGGWVLEIAYRTGTATGLRISINGYEVIYAND